MQQSTYLSKKGKVQLNVGKQIKGYAEVEIVVYLAGYTF